MKSFSLLLGICSFGAVLTLAPPDANADEFWGADECTYRLEIGSRPETTLVQPAIEAQKFVTTPYIGNLVALLKNIFPNEGYLSLLDTEGKRIEVSIDHAIDGQWFHLRFADPETFHPYIFGGGYYGRVQKFVVNPQSQNTGLSIKETFFKNNTFSITLERNEDARYYDRGFKFLQMTVEFDQLGAVNGVTLSSGRAWTLKNLWKSISVPIPPKLTIQKAVYLGDEDPLYQATVP